MVMKDDHRQPKKKPELLGGRRLKTNDEGRSEEACQNSGGWGSERARSRVRGPRSDGDEDEIVREEQGRGRACLLWLRASMDLDEQVELRRDWRRVDRVVMRVQCLVIHQALFLSLSLPNTHPT